MAALEVIRRLTLRASAEGFDKTKEAVRTLGETYETSAKKSLSVEKSLAQLQRRYDQEFRAQQDLAKAQRTLDMARAQGLVTQERAAQLMQAAIRHHNTSTTAVGAHARALGELQSQALALTGRLGSVGNVLVAMGPAGLAAAAALGALTLGMKQAADAALALGDAAGQLRDMSETTGFTVEQLQAFQIAAGRTGVSAEQLTTGIERFSAALAEIRTGSGAAFEALAAIDPALARQVATAGTVTEAWDAMSEALRTAGKEEANFAARSIFGRGGIGMVRAINEMKGGIDSFTASLRQADLITTEQAEHWDDLTDSIRENMRLAQQVISSIFTEQVLEIINDVTEAFLQFARALQETDFRSAAGQINLVTNALSMMPGPLGTIVSLLKQITDLSPARTFGSLTAGGSPAGLPVQAGAELITGSPAGLPDAEALDRRAAAMQRVGRATRETRDAAAELRKELEFAVQLEFLSDEDARIARTLVPIYGHDIPAAMASTEAAQLRFIDQMRDTKALVGDFLNDFVSGMLRGEDAVKSLGNALQGLGQSLTRTSLNQLSGQLVSGIGSSFGSLFGTGASLIGGPLAGGAVGATISTTAKAMFGENDNERTQRHQAA